MTSPLPRPLPAPTDSNACRSPAPAATCQRRGVALESLRDSRGVICARRRSVMAKGQMRSNKEKKKPKAEHNKKKKGGAMASRFALGQGSGQPAQNPVGKKGA